MPESHSPAYYKDTLLFLAAAGVAVPLFARLRISPPLGFLIVGALLGPFGLGALADERPWLAVFTISETSQAQLLGELGVVFLLFTIGLELSWPRLRSLGRLVFGMGVAQVVVCATAVAGLAWALGVPFAGAVAIGGALALSSTAIVAPMLAARHRLQEADGRATLAVLLAQDIAVPLLLVALAFLAGSGGGDPLARVALTLMPAAIGLLLLILLGRFALRPLMRSVARTDSQDLFFAACLLIVIAAGVIAMAAGLSMALGAFVAGVLLAETEFRRQVEVLVDPFKGLLLGLFFLSVGAGLNIARLPETPVLVGSLLLGSLTLKLLLVFLLARAFGVRAAPAQASAMALAPAGEFAFVLLVQATGRGLLTDQVSQAALLAATLSMFAAPLMTAAGSSLARRERRDGDLGVRPADGLPPAPRVVIAGYGRVGQLVGSMLSRHDVPWLAVDTDVDCVRAARREGAPILYGDAAHPEFLRSHDLEALEALVVTMDSPAKAEAVVRRARELRPELIIVARARDDRHAARLYELGVTDAVPETVEASLQLAENTLVDIGVPMGLVIASVHERREQFRDLFREKIEGDREPRALGSAGAARARLRENE